MPRFVRREVLMWTCGNEIHDRLELVGTGNVEKIKKLVCGYECVHLEVDAFLGSQQPHN